PGNAREMDVGGVPAGSAGGLADAVELSQDAYRIAQAKLARQADWLRTKLILTAFEALSFETRSLISSPSHFDEQRVSEQRDVVMASLRTLQISEGDIEKTVAKFFSELSSLLQRMKYKDLADLLKDKEG